MSKRAVLAIASEPQQRLLAAALEAHGVTAVTVSPSAHLETEVMHAMRAGDDPLLIVLDLAALAQLRTSVARISAWKDANCASGRLVLYCCGVHTVRPEERAWARRLGALLQRMRSSSGVAIRDRVYHAATFPSCFVGAEAVAWLMREPGLSHNEAMTLGQRLIDLYIIHHVTDEHPFRDGYFFYRFYEDERAGGI